MKKLFEKYGKREVIINTVIIAVLVILTCVLGFSYYVEYSKNNVNSTNGGSGQVVDPTPTPIEPTVTDEPVPIQTPEVTPTVTPTPEVEENFSNENEVISFFKSQENTLDTYQNQENNSSITEKVKSTFITVVDFLFYDKAIGGYTFSGLTNKAKIEVIKIALSIDNKIDEYFPNYKDAIKSGYNTIKAQLVKLYLDTTSLLCEKVGDATCNQAKEDFATMTNSFGFTFDLIKEAGGNLVDAIKTWYEIFSGKQ